MFNVRTIFVEKKSGFHMEAQELLREINEILDIKEVDDVRVLNRYDLAGVNGEEMEKVKKFILSEKNVDVVYEETFPMEQDETCFSVQYLPGQFDMRADSARQCIQIACGHQECEITTAKVVVMKGQPSGEQIQRIKSYCINSVDSREISLSKPQKLKMESEVPRDVEEIHGFAEMTQQDLKEMLEKMSLAMTLEDLKLCQSYFKQEEKRNPTITEIKVIDTYWSDHCRHTTFNTAIDSVKFEKGQYAGQVEAAYEEYVEARKKLYGDRKKDVCLMDLATLAMKELKKSGKLDDLDVSEEVNACSIKIKVNTDDGEENWLLMFKNETHNHPTEIEPFGGAATCIGGAIRDPLSGRTYVYQAMRVSGSADPRESIKDTLKGKLPQRKITTGAARGYSSYGNQIGLATGQVAEIYHEGYKAKRMELGAVIAAAPEENVVRETPKKGDLIVLMGGRTGRDGCGGATGSSKEHDEASIETCGSEVQKGNAPTERKLQRVLRNPELSKKIIRCNDFGAGGVSVAIGELSDGLKINLDLVPKKYEGLDGTELAISESQERMAAVISPEHEDQFLALCKEENIEAIVVAEVTDDNRMTITWRGKVIVDVARKFLDTNGVKQHVEIEVAEPGEEQCWFDKWQEKDQGKSLEDAWNDTLTDLNACSQRGLVEMFDSSIGAGTVLMPLGGKYQSSPQEGMAAKIPVLKGETSTASLMSYGYNPNLASWNPFLGGAYSVIEAVAKVVCMGGDYKKIRLTMQEFFEKLGKDPVKWGKPLSALLGAYKMQKELEIPAIGGKDSMSGTFKDMNVPPTIVTFAVATGDSSKIVSTEFKKAGSRVVMLKHERMEGHMPCMEQLKNMFDTVHRLIESGKVLAASSVRAGGAVETLSKMCFGNRTGMIMSEHMQKEELLSPDYGSIILEITGDVDMKEEFKGLICVELGTTQQDFSVKLHNEVIDLEKAQENWESVLEGVFRTHADESGQRIEEKLTRITEHVSSPLIKVARPKVFIPVFPGTNCEYDTARAFNRAGAETDIMVFRNNTPQDVLESVQEMEKRIRSSQMIMLSGGFSAGDEPDGSGKFIAAVFRNQLLTESVMDLIKNRDGLMLGICNGFQALIKLGLLPYGEIRELDVDSPTLTFNKIGRHVSRMVNTKVVSNLSPWLAQDEVGSIHTIPVSHGEGRFHAEEHVMRQLLEKGQVATQYVDFEGKPACDIRFNPNGSVCAVEGIVSPDGRILGKMAHSERCGRDVAKNIPGNKVQNIFSAGVNYFR